MTISFLNATLSVGPQPLVTKVQTSIGVPDPNRYVLSKSTSTSQDGTRVTTTYYSDKETEVKTEKPIKASVKLEAVPASRVDLLV